MVGVAPTHPAVVRAGPELDPPAAVGKRHHPHRRVVDPAAGFGLDRRLVVRMARHRRGPVPLAPFPAGISETVAMKLTGHRMRSLFQRYAIVGEGMLQEAGAQLTQEAGSKVAASRGKVIDLAR
jgi:hypothetical protein